MKQFASSNRASPNTMAPISVGSKSIHYSTRSTAIQDLRHWFKRSSRRKISNDTEPRFDLSRRSLGEGGSPGAESRRAKIEVKIDNLFSELKRRNVYKVAAAYTVVGWLLVQVATQVFPFFEIPNWAVRLIVLAIVIGFPIALVITWAFELTPEGLKRTEDVDRAATAQRPRHRTWIFVMIIAGAMSLGLFLLGR